MRSLSLLVPHLTGPLLRPVTALALSPDGTIIFSAAADGVAEVQPSSGELLHRWTPAKTPLTCIAAAPGTYPALLTHPTRLAKLHASSGGARYVRGRQSARSPGS